MLIKSLESRLSVQELYVAGNLGPCGGVNMAIEAARQVLDIVDGREPVFSNWDLVNNKPLMDKFKKRGLLSVQNNWDLAEDGSIVFFSAHGVPPTFRQIARERNYLVIDVTCQLVNRVHLLVNNAEAAGKHIVYIGVAGHPETEGVRGEVKAESLTLIESPEDLDRFELPKDKPLVCYSQTTQAPRIVGRINAGLRERYPEIEIPSRLSICYATDNRQDAVEALIPKVNGLVVVGSKHSHNSKELQNYGLEAGLPSYLIDLPEELDPGLFKGIRRLGLTSGASVLEEYLTPVIDWFRDRNPQMLLYFEKQVREEKWMTFKLPEKDIEALRARYQEN